MRGGFTIARILGIPIRVNPSWFASLLLVVSILSLEVLPSTFPGKDAALYWSLALAGGIVYFASIVLHELGHSVVARRYGIPVTGITLFIFGGVAQIAREASRPWVELLMAIAGPLVSLGLGCLFLAVRFFIMTADTPVSLLIEWLGLMNLVLAVFNLLPGFPMDGGRLLRSTIWGISGNYRLATRVAGWLSRGLSILIMGAGLAEALQLPNLPVQTDPIGGIWLILVGVFLNSAAGQAQRQARLLDVMRGYRADQLLISDVPTVSADSSVRSVVYEVPLQQDHLAYFVYSDGRLVGLLPRSALARVPAARWGDVTVADVMIAADKIRPATPEEDGASLMQRMDADGLPALPVVRDGAVIGLVTRAALTDLVRRDRTLRRAFR